MTLSSRSVRHACVWLIVAALAAGCEKRREVQTTTLVPDDSEYICTIMLDLSGSFSNLMAEQGKAYEFAMQVIDRYFRDRIASNDKIIIAQISGTKRSLLWQGTPTELHRDFPTADDFRKYLLAKADPGGSLVHDGVTHAVQYVLSEPNVANGKAKSAVFILSDMLDNGPSTTESEQRAVTAIADYGRKGGVVGIYYVDQLRVPVWRDHLKQAGIRQFCIESEIVGRPRLPDFE